MKALMQDRLGLPTEVVELRDAPMPRPGPGQRLVRMTAAAIHPGDFFFTQGLYPEAKRPRLPGQIVGNHGVGRLVDGEGDGPPAGALVAFSAGNAWAEYAAVDARALVPLAEDYPVERAVQLMPAITARDLLTLSEVTAGDWLAVTAGHSLVSGLVIQMARRRGVRVIAVVRRRIPGRDLTALGAEVVLTLAEDGPRLGQAVRDATGGAGVKGVVDAVGGEVLSHLMEALAFEGRVVIVGAYDIRPFRASALTVLMELQEVRSYVYRYFFKPPPPSDADYLHSVLEELREPSLVAPTAGWHPVEDFRTALVEAAERPEAGKRILTFA